MIKNTHIRQRRYP